jgi:hypothetical protein
LTKWTSGLRRSFHSSAAVPLVSFSSGSRRRRAWNARRSARALSLAGYIQRIARGFALPARLSKLRLEPRSPPQGVRRPRRARTAEKFLGVTVRCRCRGGIGVQSAARGKIDQQSARHPGYRHELGASNS